MRSLELTNSTAGKLQVVRGISNSCINTSRQKTVQEVFNPKSALHGVNELKRKIAKLPTSEEVIWFDRQTLSGRKVRGSERLMYPPKEIMQDVKHEAESHGVKVSGPDETS